MLLSTERKQSPTAERTRVLGALRQRKFRRVHGPRRHGRCNVIRTSASADSGSESDVELLWRTGWVWTSSFAIISYATCASKTFTFRPSIFDVSSNALRHSWVIILIQLQRDFQLQFEAVTPTLIISRIQRKLSPGLFYNDPLTFRPRLENALPGRIRALLPAALRWNVSFTALRSSILPSAIIADVPL